MKKYTALAALSFLVAVPAFAALADHFDQSRVATILVTCPLEAGTPCVVEVTRVRPLLSAFQAEADALGLNMAPIPDRVVKRSTTRAQLASWLSATTLVP